MAEIIRRWWVFMGISALLNLAALALVGHFWRPLPIVAPAAPMPMVTLTLLPPVQKIPLPPRSKPPPRPKPQPPRPRPRMMATPLPPSPRLTPKDAVPADGGGGARPRPKPRPKPATKFHLLAPAAPQAEVPQAAKTAENDRPDDMDAADGLAPPAPGSAKSSDPGKTAGDAPGTGGSAARGDGSAGTGTGSGSGAGAGNGSGLFGTHGSGGGGSAPRHIVYVLDISGSMDMTEQKFGGKRRIDQARDELDKQFQTLADGETFSLIAFSDEVRLFRQQLVKADTGTIRDAEKFLDRLKPDGDTDLEGALKAALAIPDINVVVVITDGVPRTPDFVYSTPDDFYKLATRITAMDSAHVPIYAYGLLGPNPDGTDESKQAAGLLAQIAADSGGKFEEVKLAGERQ